MKTFRKNQNHNWVMLTNNQVSLTHFTRCLTLALTHKWSHYTVKFDQTSPFLSTVGRHRLSCGSSQIERNSILEIVVGLARRQERILFFHFVKSSKMMWKTGTIDMLELGSSMKWISSLLFDFFFWFLQQPWNSIDTSHHASSCVCRQRSDNFTHIDLLHISCDARVLPPLSIDVVTTQCSPFVDFVFSVSRCRLLSHVIWNVFLCAGPNVMSPVLSLLLLLRLTVILMGIRVQ